MTTFSIRVTRTHLHLDLWLKVAFAPGALPFVVFCSSAQIVPLSDTDTCLLGLTLGTMSWQGFWGLTFAGWVAVL